MDYRKLPTATLKQIEAAARQEIAKGEAEGRPEDSKPMRIRYGVLGAVSAVLAQR
jgi:hypothetical protein